MVLYHGRGQAAPLNRFYSPNIVNLQGEKHVFFMGKTQLVPAGYMVNKNGLGGSVWVRIQAEPPHGKYSGGNSASFLTSKLFLKNMIFPDPLNLLSGTSDDSK